VLAWLLNVVFIWNKLTQSFLSVIVSSQSFKRKSEELKGRTSIG